MAPSAQAQPLESHCHTELPGDAIDGYIDHARLGQRLAQIEHNSRGRVEVDVAGYSNHGREIWTAQVGEGDELILVNSRIHGNEKQNVSAVLNLLQTLGGSSPYAQEVREAVTLVSCRCSTPTAAKPTSVRT